MYPVPLPPHVPHRGSDVESFIKEFRDRYPKHSPGFVTVDDLLDQYRLRADTGLDLRQGIEQPGAFGERS